MKTPRLGLAAAAGVLLAPLLATLPTSPAGRTAWDRAPIRRRR